MVRLASAPRRSGRASAAGLIRGERSSRQSVADDRGRFLSAAGLAQRAGEGQRAADRERLDLAVEGEHRIGAWAKGMERLLGAKLQAVFGSGQPRWLSSTSMISAADMPGIRLPRDRTIRRASGRAGRDAWRPPRAHPRIARQRQRRAPPSARSRGRSRRIVRREASPPPHRRFRPGPRQRGCEARTTRARRRRCGIGSITWLGGAGLRHGSQRDLVVGRRRRCRRINRHRRSSLSSAEATACSPSETGIVCGSAPTLAVRAGAISRPAVAVSALGRGAVPVRRRSAGSRHCVVGRRARAGQASRCRGSLRDLQDRRGRCPTSRFADKRHGVAALRRADQRDRKRRREQPAEQEACDW